MGFPYDGAGFEPSRKFTIGTSDYTNYVTRWPKISRASNKLKSTKVKVQLANADQEFNNFYTNLYSIPNTCTLSCDSYTLFVGFLSDVQYNREKCDLSLRDRLSDLEVRKIGDSDSVISFAPQIPSDIAWTITTCYGALDSTQGSNNADIDYDMFALWAETFSVDSVEIEANYDGQKLTQALEDLGKMTNSDIWIARNGLLKFKARFDVASNDTTIDHEHVIDLSIRLSQDKLINDQYIYGAYSSDNSNWSLIRNSIDQASQNSYGVHQNIIKNTHVWYQSSVYAGVIADKRILQYKHPVREFTVKTPFVHINTTIGDRVRLVDSFFSITSEYAWRAVSEKIDMSNGQIEFELDSAQSFEPFYLDVSNLDGNYYLL
jgi:hypothetical protein